MRAHATKNGISTAIYAGTTGVLLGFNVTPARRNGLLGFAIKRIGPGNRKTWLKTFLRFPGEALDFRTPQDSRLSPIQKFRWSDYGVYPGTRYRYSIEAVYGQPGRLRYKAGPQFDLSTESLERGMHRIIFNRAAAASQAFARRFGNINPDKPVNQEARDWLSRGLRKKLLAFLQRANGPQWALDIAIYEFELPEIADLLVEALNHEVQVRVVYHAKVGDKQTIQNKRELRPLPRGTKKARITKAIFHDKFVVLSRINAAGEHRARAVLTGSTNFTLNGVYRQANVVHIVEDQLLADTYLELFEGLFGGIDTRNTKRWINTHNPVDYADPLCVLFSPRSNLTDIGEVAEVIKQARRDVIFCTAFRLHNQITRALTPARPGKLIRYGLQNTRSEITGYHRGRSYTAPTFLKRSVEGFLKESTAGQRGNILIHLKTIMTDFSSDNPTVITGSNNFSTNASARNDENMLIIRGETDVADTYGCEMMRLYDHYRFRYNRKKKKGARPGGRIKPLALDTDDLWTKVYFRDGTNKSRDRVIFSRSRP